MIHQYKLGNLCVVLDVCSGSVHAVDEVAYDMIAGFETQERETLVDALAEKYRDREDVTRPELEECYDQLLALNQIARVKSIGERDQRAANGQRQNQPTQVKSAANGYPAGIGCRHKGFPQALAGLAGIRSYSQGQPAAAIFENLYYVTSSYLFIPVVSAQPAPRSHKNRAHGQCRSVAGASAHSRWCR